MTTATIYTPNEKNSYLAGLRVSAILETVVFLLIMLVADWVIGDGVRFWGMQPHPFWVIVILIAVQYGTSEAIFAAILASVVLLLGNTPEQSLRQDMYDYLFHLFKLPLLWLIGGVVIGELRQRHIRERDYLRNELRSAKHREETIAHSYRKVTAVKEQLELKIASQLRASVDTYRAARAIEKNNPAEVLQGVQELVSSVLRPEKFSVYLLNNDGLATTITFGWDEEDHYEKQFDTFHELYREVIGKQQSLCIANRDHQLVLGDQGVLAGPLIDQETGEINGMLKIEKMGFLDLNLSTIETFHAICEWVGMAMVNANRYQDAKEDSMVNPDHNLLSHNYFRRYTDYISSLGKRVGFSVNMIVVTLTNADRMSPEERVKSARKISDVVKVTLRSVDMAFDYQKDGREFSVVLPATNAAGARVVMEKMEKGLRKEMPKSGKAEFALAIHSIHEAE